MIAMNTREKSSLRPEPPVTEAVKAEVLRRRATLDQNKKTARPAQDVLADLRHKYTGSR